MPPAGSTATLLLLWSATRTCTKLLPVGCTVTMDGAIQMITLALWTSAWAVRLTVPPERSVSWKIQCSGEVMAVNRLPLIVREVLPALGP